MVELINLGVNDVGTIQTLFANQRTYYTHNAYRVNYPRFRFNVNAPHNYNSNSYVHGILIASGIGAPSPESRLPGWDSPLPQTYFWGSGDLRWNYDRA